MHTYKLNKHTDLLLLQRGAFGTSQVAGISGYLSLPLDADEHAVRGTAWRVLLELTGKTRGLLPFEFLADVVMGRGSEGPDCPDLDLTALNALELGVSRRHALFRPTEHHLFLIDLGSTNGTFVNGLRITGMAHPLVQNDHISLGKLNMSILHLEAVPGTCPRPEPESEDLPLPLHGDDTGAPPTSPLDP